MTTDAIIGKTAPDILVDRNGILRDVSFGTVDYLEPLIRDLLEQVIG